MSMRQWLLGLDEATLESWANRGLLRRARKLLESASEPYGVLDEQGARASLEGYEQTLGGVGFDALNCTCPAFGPCQHLLALLLGLQQQLAREPQVVAPAVVTHDEPWRVDSAEALQQLFGRAVLNRAQRWMAQGHRAQIRIDARQLQARLALPRPFELSIPRAGGLPASLCSCRETGCAHRALVMLQLGDQWQLQAANALRPSQLQVLEALDVWLEAFLKVGLGAVSGLLVASAQALATELQQADLPRLGRLLARLGAALEDERQAMAASSVRQLRQLLAELLAYRRALARTPLPQPLPVLAGLHRQRFEPCQPSLELYCLAAQCWQTQSGYRGFSLYFMEAGSGRCYSLSESRSLALEPRWEPQVALQQGHFGGVALSSLIGMHCLLERGWASDQGRLSNREGTCLRKLGPWQEAALPALRLGASCWLTRLARQRRQWLYHSEPDGWGMLDLRLSQAPTFERLSQRWQGLGHDAAGDAVALLLAAGPEAARAAATLQRFDGQALWLFGNWRLQGRQIGFWPVAFYTPGHGLVQLFCEGL